MLGLVLTAGGARGAYQAGVLKRMGEIPRFRGQPAPFPIITGASAGALNGTFMAALHDDFAQGTALLGRLWSELQVDQVFRSDLLSLGKNVARLLTDLALGSLTGGGLAGSLLDASPLDGFLRQRLPLEGIGSAIRRGDLYALAITATSYHSGRSYTFIQGRAGHPLWQKSRRVTLPVNITVDHVRASAAIPIVFAPVRLTVGDSDLYFGDGGLRLVTPISPAIRLGASHVFGIGIRSHKAANDLARVEATAPEASAVARPPLGQVCGVFLNAIFLDHLDTDLDHLLRMNELLRAYGSEIATHVSDPVTGTPSVEPMRMVTPLVVNPSEDLAVVAKAYSHRMPRMVRYLMDGLGTPDAQSADLMSYLLFDSQFTRALVDIGYHDASKRIDEIDAFLEAGQAEALRNTRVAS